MANCIIGGADDRLFQNCVVWTGLCHLLNFAIRFFLKFALEIYRVWTTVC